jgi:two-component system, NarL family, response regulator YdfI
VIRLFIVASSTLARSGVQSLIEPQDLKIVGSASSLESLSDRWENLEADILLIDASGELLTAAIDFLSASDLAYEVPVVILSDHPEPKGLADALRVGVRAVLPSEISSEQLVSALRAAAAGLTVMHSADVATIFRRAQQSTRALADLAESLTPRESEVLQMLASGLGNKEIAAQLKISEHTVKFHVAAILGKLGAGSRTEAVAIGIRRGLVLL